MWIHDYMDNFPPDLVRYYLSANMPDTSDSDFSWSEFVRKNNGELVATYGNLVHRVLTMSYRNFEGRAPTPGALSSDEDDMLAKVEQTFSEVDDLLYRCRFREAVRQAMGLAQEGNRYLDRKAPWKQVKEDKDAAATTLWCALSVVEALKTILYPFLPFSSRKLHWQLGLGELDESSEWKIRRPEGGRALQKPSPLFAKLEDEVAEVETARLGQASG